jgi:hypothetical protein
MEQTSYSSVGYPTTNPLAEEAPDLLTNKSLISSTWPLGKNDSGKWLERGRTVQRVIRPSNPLERAESRNHMRDATVEVDVQSIKPRYCRSVAFFEDPADPCAAFEDNLLEPCPHDPVCNNVSEMIARPIRNCQNGVDTPSPVAGFVRTNSNKFHDISRMSTCSKTSLLVDTRSLYPAPTLAADAVLELLPKLNHAEYMFIKSSSEVWCSTTNSQRRLSIMSLLPAEILCQIYNSLSPADFNSARHACRLWYINSLDRSLLETMLKRGGWSTSIHNEPAFNHVLDSQALVNDEWLMSKRIARECALGPDWTGNGLCPATESLKCLYTTHESKSTPFIYASITDFTEIGVHYPGVDEPTSGISFTVSTCGKFLMVAHGCLVYIYELNCNQYRGEMADDRQNGALRPVTSVICPRRVLACSMDTSSHRYAIAVLLDGRMGLVCDLTSLRDRTQHWSSSRYRMSQDAPLSRGNEYRNRVSISSSRSRVSHRAQTDQPFVFPIIAAEASQSSFPLESERNVWEDITQFQVPTHDIPSADQSRATTRMLFGQTGFQGHATNLFPRSMSVESSIPTLYAPLCSADDMPRSVALCPQRRCVAFGCSSGIELHWVDALTGQDLNRWFPLTAPSDYLYFLPPRPGVDSAKKLRLISSAGRPGENSVIAQRYGGTKSGTHASPFWGVQPAQHDNGPADVASANRSGLSTPSRDNSDHYRAVPLSDGYHILFTDPSTGLLCLGGDAPIGGPTKLLRKIWFAGPQGQGSPVTYTGGSDLRCGVRVVAAYGHGTEQNIWLFSVPPDVFTESQAKQGGINLPFAGISSGTGSGNHDWVKWWCNVDSTNSPEPIYGASHAMIIRHDRLWPIQVRGQEIGRCHGVVDLAIDAGPEMTIWAFGKEGLAKTWQIDDGSSDVTSGKRVLVMRDGTIRESDAGGDIQMVDTSLPFDETLPTTGTQDQGTFDGSASMPSSGILLGQRVWNCQGSGSQNIVNLDADGDVLMADLRSPESPVYENWSAELFESVALVQNGQEALFHPDRFSGPAYVEVNGQDLVNMLTGIAHIDIEIR